MALALLLLVVLAGADAAGTSCSHRAERLLRQMTLAEKGPQLYNFAPAIPRLHVPAFNFWSEGCHGYTSLQQPGGTMFPTPLALGATFNTHLMFKDPLLMARLVVAFVRGLQDRRRHQVKVMATCKHFAAYSLEASDGWTRHNFDARVDARDLAESYLPAFEACVREGEAGSVMCSYNRLNGVPACANHDLLDTTLRRHWGFKGFVVSDCGAVSDIADGHKVAAGILQAVAQSTKAGCDLNCDGAAFNITDSVLGGHMRESDVDTVLKRVLEARCVLGVLSDRRSDREVTPWDDLKFDVVGSRKHLALARTAAAQSMVLLVNRPVSAWGWRSPCHQQGGKGPVTTPLQAIQELLAGTLPPYLDGLNYWVTNLMTREDVAAGVVFVGGSSLNPMNGQDGLQRVQTENEGLDRFSLRLTGAQEQLVQAASRGGKPLVVVLMAGGPLDISPLLALPNLGDPPGIRVNRGGRPSLMYCLAKSPPRAACLSPPTLKTTRNSAAGTAFKASMSNMDMRPWPGRTYRYLQAPSLLPHCPSRLASSRCHGCPWLQVPSLFPFGHGLSYVRWRYSRLQLRPCRHPADPQPPHSLDGPPLDPDRDLTGQAGGEEAGTSPDLTGGGEGGCWPSPGSRCYQVSGGHSGSQGQGQTCFVELPLPRRQFMSADVDGMMRVVPGKVEVRVGPLALPLHLKAT
ncbi:glycoside hydrolase superfamily [Haematococcus lacustris]